MQGSPRATLVRAMLAFAARRKPMAPSPRLRRFELPIHQCEVVERAGPRTVTRLVLCPVSRVPRTVDECERCNDFVAARELPLEDAFVCCIATVHDEEDTAAHEPVSAALGRRAVVLREDVELGQALKIMATERLRSLPVVSRNGDIVGVLSDLDVIRSITRK
jgi:hypothetical protein